MNCIVPRTCTILQDDAEAARSAGSRPLAAFRTKRAYVLLGDPGAGKTTSFEAEYDALGKKEACLTTARDFLALDPDPQWREKTLFIDGLDEAPAGSDDARTRLDKLRQRIDRLGRPRFRLSCREADWLGPNDRRNLARVTPDGKLTVLRLDPLTEDDIKRILDARSGIDDVRWFMDAAKQKGVAGFLDNPQCLGMLADVVTTGRDGWTGSRRKLFERACLRMVREYNEEHCAAEQASGKKMTAVHEDLLDAAGRLCTLLLISGSAGWAIVRSSEDADYPHLSQCGREYQAQCRQAISTKLFKGAAEGRFQPVHRHVAEFLAGRYLARLIEGERRNGRRARQGVPVRRVVALMTGHDGGVVTELRGVSAWIAAQGQTARNEFVERDPIGVGLYGDIGEFSPREKRDLLASLERLSSRIHLVSGATAAFGSLATKDIMQPAIEEILRDACREPEHQSFVGFVLDVLPHGATLPDLTDDLLALVYDHTWSSRITASALRAFLHHCTDGAEKTNRLKTLLADVHAGVVPDPDEDLRGLLLSKLFPRDVPPSEVWRYLTTQDPSLIGSCWRFWAQQIPDESSDEEVIELLDGLRRRFSDLRLALETRPEVGRASMRLMARALDLQGATTDTKRLYDWLGVGLFSRRGVLMDEATRIRSWLEGHPEIQKAVFAEGVDRCADDGPGIDASDVWDRLYGSKLPADFGLWCLDQAVGAADARTARYYLERAFRAVDERSGDDGLSLEVLIRRTSAHPILSSIFSDLSVCRLNADYTNSTMRRERRVDGKQREIERERKHRKWIDYVRSNEASLRANSASPSLLHQIATAYFRAQADVEDADLWARLRNDGRLVAAALDALRGAIRRDDLPDAAEIIRLRGQTRQHYLALPVLAGLAECERAAPDESLDLDDRRIRTALAFHYCCAYDTEPPWYRRLLGTHPRLVAEMLIESAKPELRNRRHVAGLGGLVDGDHEQVARIASLPLLRAFPVRSANRQLTDLRYLLWAALRHADPEALENLVAQKLSRGSMDVAQRAYWLTAGLVSSPTTRLRPLEEFAQRGERRVRHIAAFLGYRPDSWSPIDRLQTEALQLLIRLVGRTFGPSGQSGRVTLEMQASDRMQWMISRLAESPTDEAREALETLAPDETEASDKALSQWRAALLQARDDQLVVHRDATYSHSDIEEICLTLDDRSPANPADLAALTVDRLEEIARGVGNDNANGWRPFWNEDRHRRPDTPKHEESCRDALLRELRPWLPDGVAAEPEVRYANDKRADICISCRDFQIPVELKKNSHSKLWSALRDQLMAQYARDPETDGYGIYLVLWFGEVNGHRTPPPPSGVRPHAPDALRACLEETLTPEEARKIAVCVIDVSAPAG